MTKSEKRYMGHEPQSPGIYLAHPATPPARWLAVAIYFYAFAHVITNTANWGRHLTINVNMGYFWTVAESTSVVAFSEDGLEELSKAMLALKYLYKCTYNLNTI